MTRAWLVGEGHDCVGHSLGLLDMHHVTCFGDRDHQRVSDGLAPELDVIGWDQTVAFAADDERVLLVEIDF